MASLVLAAIWGGGLWLQVCEEGENGEDVSCGTEGDDSVVGML